MSDLKIIRQFYAEELRAAANLQSEALVRAFAKVPREHFLGPGPWQMFSPGSENDWTTQDADPRHLYHNLLVVIDADRQLNNGHPSFVASLIEQLELKQGSHVVHIGCGPGYYTAVMAEVVGIHGFVTAIEIDPQLAAAARTKLNYLPHVKVFEADGTVFDPGLCDAILVNAGATHPHSIWLDSLRPGGRLILPLTVTDEDDVGGSGRVLKITRQPQGFTACFVSPVRIFPCMGGRDNQLNQPLKQALDQGDWKTVQSLRRDFHNREDSCWFHSDQFCLSKIAVASSNNSDNPAPHDTKRS